MSAHWEAQPQSMSASSVPHLEVNEVFLQNLQWWLEFNAMVQLLGASAYHIYLRHHKVGSSDEKYTVHITDVAFVLLE